MTDTCKNIHEQILEVDKCIDVLAKLQNIQSANRPYVEVCKKIMKTLQASRDAMAALKVAQNGNEAEQTLIKSMTREVFGQGGLVQKHPIDI